jgi:hypothetical protein
MSDSHFTTFPLFSEDLGPPSKRCHRCRQVKPLTEFGKDKNRPLSVYPICKKCKSDYAKYKWKNDRKYREKYRAYVRKFKYGIDRVEYERMLAAQDGRCAICGQLPRGTRNEEELHVDHSHVSGRLRMLLCLNCNNGLGKFNDDIDLLRRAVEYLERFRDETTG